MDDEAGHGLHLERKLLQPGAPPVPAFHFLITRVGEQILLEPGYIDLVEMRMTLEKIRSGDQSSSAPIQLFIRESYLLDRATLERLRDAADQILQRIEEGKKT